MKRICRALLLPAVCSFISLVHGQSLDLGGTNAYVSFGNTPSLGLGQFTLECWVKKEGAGVSVSSGSGGVTAIPLVTKGRGEGDGSTVDMNYFFGIESSTGLLAADFEEITPGPNPGLNHPIVGSTTVTPNVWHHVAATYDGNEWKLYLDGNLDASLVVGRTPQSGSIQHAGLGTAMNSSGDALGFFDGVIDEVRIWNYARTIEQIRETLNQPIKSAAGLVASWRLNEGAGTFITDSSGNSITGTIIGSNYSWPSGNAPFDINIGPNPPVSVSPADGDSCQTTNASLSVAVSDPENDALTVRFYGRIKRPAGEKFTIIPLPDTQYYTAEINGGSNATYKAQTSWITAHRDSLNIVFVSHLGDCVENGDNGGNDIEWRRADTAMQVIEDPVTTHLQDGIPYGMNVGNHDQSPKGDPNGTTVFFNQYFGESRFLGRNYWGGKYRSNSDNNFQLFSTGGMDFIVINFEYDQSGNTAVPDWADSLLVAYSSRRAIISSHFLLDGSGNYSAQGQAVYNALKDRPNFFLMLCGHVSGESRRTDIFGNDTVYTIMSDYQGRSGGGDGWLRIMEFDPAANTISVKTFSPKLNRYETDANSQFVLPYNMEQNTLPWQLIGTVSDISGSAGISWEGLLQDSTYEWYTTVSDGNATVQGATRTFTASAASVSLGPDTCICSDCSIVLSAGDGFVRYSWSTGETSSQITIDDAGMYSIEVQNAAGCIAADTVEICVVSGSGDLLSDKTFFSVFPNPFSRIAALQFELKLACSPVTLSLADMSGKVVHLLEERALEKGVHTYMIDAEKMQLPPGIYLIKLRAGESVITKQLVRL